MHTYISRVDWADLVLSLELDAQVRWMPLGLLALVAASALLACGSGRQAVRAALLGLGLGVLALLSVPSCDVLSVLGAAWGAMATLALALASGLWAAVVGAMALRLPSRALQAVGAGTALGGLLFAALQTSPYLEARAEVLAVGPLPAPVYTDIVEAHVGSVVTRPAPLVHELREGSLPADPASWGLDQPIQVHVAAAGPSSAPVRFSRGPVRLEMQVATLGLEDRGPEIWPLAVGDEVKLGPEPAAPATRTLRVVSSEPRDGFLTFQVEIEEGQQRRTVALVRGDGALYEMDAGERRPWFVAPGDGTCTFDGLPCTCASSQWTRCDWTPEKTPVVDAVVRTVFLLGTFGLVDPKPDYSPQGLVVLSRKGSLR